MSSLSHLTKSPLETNNITLDPDLKDAWGLPAMRVTYKLHPDDMANMRFMLARQREVFEAAGAKKVWDQGVRDITGSVHLMGTARMGNDPKTSVVDKFNRAHGREKSLCGRWFQFRDVRPAATDADHSGARLPLRRFHDSGGERRTKI